jgi:ABC-type amino acid transport substrate-binding protein
MRTFAVGLAFSVVAATGALAGGLSLAQPGAALKDALPSTSSMVVKVADTPALDRVRKDGIKIAYSKEEPWDYIDSSGKLVGMEVEIAQSCAAKLGISKVDFIETEFDSLIPGVAAHRWDLEAGGTNLSPERLQVAISTQPMYAFGTKLLVKKGNPLNFHNWTDVGKSGKTIGLAAGATQDTLDRLAKFGVKYNTYPTVDAEIADLVAGRIDGVLNAELSLFAYVKANPDAGVEVALPWDYQGLGISTPGQYFNKGDVDLRDAWNDCISDLKTSGKMKELAAKYGFDPTQIPPVGPGAP